MHELDVPEVLGTVEYQDNTAGAGTAREGAGVGELNAIIETQKTQKQSILCFGAFLRFIVLTASVAFASEKTAEIKHRGSYIFDEKTRNVIKNRGKHS